MMDRKIEQLSKLFYDVENICFFCDAAGKILWRNACADGGDFAGALQDTVYNAFPQSKEILDTCFMGEEEQKEFSLRYFASSVTGSMQAIVGDDGKRYFLFKIFSKNPNPYPYQPKRKTDMVSLGAEYRNGIFNIYNLLSVLEQLFEEAGYYEEMEYLNSIGKNCRKMLKTTINMNEYFRFQDGENPFSVEVISLQTLLDGLMGQISFLTKDSGRKVRFLVEEKDIFVQIDTYKFTLAFLNIIANALEFSLQEGEILVKLGKIGESALLTVENDGDALTGEVAKRAFEPFYSQSPLTGRSKGLGLGLYVSDEIIRAMGGSITIASRKEGGTKVSIRLPLKEEVESKTFRSSEFVRDLIVDKLSLLYVMLSDCTDVKNF